MKVEQQQHKDNEDLKRKQSEVVLEPQYPSKSPKKDQDGQKSSSSNHQKGSNKQQKQKERLDWRHLRPPKSSNKKG